MECPLYDNKVHDDLITICVCFRIILNNFSFIGVTFNLPCFETLRFVRNKEKKKPVTIVLFQLVWLAYLAGVK
jgi:hypothetical protein